MRGEARSSGRFARVLLAHLVAYPIAFAWAVAAIPLLFPIYEDALIGLYEMQQVADFLLAKIAWFAALTFVLTHLAVIPWALAAPLDRGKRLFVISACALFSAAVVTGGVGWTWLLLR